MPQYNVPPELYDQSLPQIATAKAVAAASLSKFPLLGTETIVDACCGTGKLAEFLSEYVPNGQVIGLDNAENMIAFARQSHSRNNISFRLDDLTVFNESLRKSADLLVCSWAVSHIPSEKQEAFTANLFQYLRSDGRLIILFPVMGSLLSTTIQEVAKSDTWRDYFKDFENKRMTFTVDEYNKLLMKTGFVNRKVQTCQEDLIFQDRTDLLCFITTAAARYLPYLSEPELRASFIDDISNHYQAKVGSKDKDIPYSMTMLTAVATKPSLALLLQRADSPINTSESPTTNEEHMLVNTQSYKTLLGQLDLSSVTVIEFGAGDGALTELILECRPKKIIAYELNPELAEKLKCRLSGSPLEIHIADFTTVDFSYLNNGEQYVIISNPPYSTLRFLTEQVIRRFHLQDVILMTSAKKAQAYFSDYSVAFSLSGNDFSPPARGEHVVMRKGFQQLTKPLTPPRSLSMPHH